MKLIIIIVLAFVLLIPISSVDAFESEFYDGFFISYGRCETMVDTDSEMMKITLSKTISESLADSFCEQTENSRFEYDYSTSNEIWTKKLKFEQETSWRFYTDISEGGIPFVLPTSWNLGEPLNLSIETLSDVKYVGTNTKEINDKTIKVHEFEETTFLDEDGMVAEFQVQIQYDVESGFLVSTNIRMNFAHALLGGGSGSVMLEATDISEKPLIENIIDTSSKGGGCLIATATYGSELAPQVQELREIRDSKLLQTESGVQFMSTFNDFYYSFSPIIADYERENPVFKEVVKVAITPMISSLSLLNYVDMDSESEVIGYGIALIMLNGLMYVGIPASVIVVIRKF